MGTPANIIIEFKNKSFLLPKGKDQILLFCGCDGYPFGLGGAMYLMVKVYENLKNTERYSKHSNMLSPEDFASELIRISFLEKFGFCNIMPATRLMFEQYDKKGYFVDKAFEYICNFKFDDSHNSEMTLTLKDYDNEATKSMTEWKDICNIAYQIAIAENEKYVQMKGKIPCKKCLVQATCVVNGSDESFVNNVCDDLKEYKKNENIRLLEKLPKWATPFVTFPQKIIIPKIIGIIFGILAVGIKGILFLFTKTISGTEETLVLWSRQTWIFYMVLVFLNINRINTLIFINRLIIALNLFEYF